ncbi:MAG: tripartite tricarboxylate transporter TctB family protein [Burkholderiaceae bacterium]
MSRLSQFKKDYYGGALMVIIGVAAAYTAAGYHLGTLARMGPGFFPCAVGVLLALIGLAIALSARFDKGPPAVSSHGYGTGMPDLRGAACIIAGILAFLLFGEYGGLLPASFAIVFISALGDRGNTVKQAALLALGMCAIAGVVFWWALQLQLPLFRWGG